ncbi:MAG: choice-of-anchor L domain-containing protein, partial [Myxococcota bacterium]
ADGAPLANPGLAVGLVPQFGTNAVAQNGAAMVVLSSGYARPLSHPEECGNTSCSHSGSGTAPPNFPQDVPGCTGGTNINDDVALELQLRAPSNATGYSFDFAFMSFEFPEYVCTTFNDQFIALVQPPPMGSVNGNISFDSLSNPVSINIALFDHCDPSAIGQYTGPVPPNPYCPQGTAFMAGTGFNAWDTFSGSGATGWLQTTAPIGPNETFTIRYAIWDTGDTALDSTVFIDNFQWIAEAGVQVGTGEIPDPK